MPHIDQVEKVTQTRVIKFFVDKLHYTYLGDLHDSENSNIMQERLYAYLTGMGGYSDKLARRAIDELVRTAANLQRGLYDANKQVYCLLKYGAKISEEAGEAPKTVFFINFENPAENDFAIAEEVTVVGNNTKRPDLVVYVNGIALAVIELKRSSVSVSEGIRQNLTNQTAHFIEKFFTTVQFCMAGNDSEGLRYGTLLTPEKHYYEWQDDGFGEFPEERNETDVLIEEKSKAIEHPLDKQLYAMFYKKRFLDLIHNFIIFDKGIKKVCRYNQYYAIKRAQYRLTQEKRGGIIWHTQGSGKTLTMIWLSKWLLSNNPNARVLIVTDREELDDQIEKAYKGVDETIARTKSGDDLVKRLNAFDDRLICSLIHKFGKKGGDVTDKDIDKYIEEIKAALPENYCAKGDFIVFVDECHRTQSGKLHAAMKTIIPNGIFVGFTGTPLLKKDKKTSLETFGGYIHTYKFDEAVRDGVVLDLRYEYRDVPQKIKSQNQIDIWFDIKTKGLTPRAKAKLKSMWATMQIVYSSRSRLERIAIDINMDFEKLPRLMDGNGNAMLVASSVYSACKYYEIFQQIGFKKCAIISSYEPQAGDLRTDTVSDDEETETFEKYDIYQKMLGGQSVEDFEKEAKRKFVEEPANMKLLIVVDKLLTGFDAPPCTYLYIDKAMHDHGLFQAICRVNRLDGESKDFGYIVDYKQLFGDLADAINTYTSGAFEDYDAEDVEGLLKDRTKESKKYFLETLDALDELCEGVAVPRVELDYIHYFCGENGVDPDNDEAFARSREKLYKLVSRLIRAYAEFKPRMDDAGFSATEQSGFEERVNTYIKLREVIGRASGDFLDFKQFEPGMRYLIDNYIVADDAEKIAIFDDFTLLDFILAQEDRLNQDGEGKEQESAAEAIENNIRKKVVQKIVINPAYYSKMSEVLEQLILDRKRGVIAYKQLLERYLELAKKDGILKYSLRSLAFPAFIATNVTLDPGILFVVLNPDERGNKRVFWKYMSVDFINSLDFNKKSATICFSADEEIFDTEESIISFCKKLESIVARHSFVNKLSEKELCKSEIDKIIIACDKHITAGINLIDDPEYTRDDVSHYILPRLYDMCRSALLLNSLRLGNNQTNLQLAWEQALLKIETKYLATFLKGLKYIEDREPDEGQSERLMLKYYNFLWQIRDFLYKEYGMSVLHNLEKFPLHTDKTDTKYYEQISDVIKSVKIIPQKLSGSKFYVTKKVPFFVGKERYYEVTLQLAGVYATKYNRITAYTKENITTNYSVQIAYINAKLNLWGLDSTIKIITNWGVAIEPSSLNKLAKILYIRTTISSNYIEYNSLMKFLTESGISLLDLIDLKEVSFSKILDSIYCDANTSYFKEVLIKLRESYSKDSLEFGRNTVRYLLINLREETIEKVQPWTEARKMLSPNLRLSTKCYPFEKNPFISNLFCSNTSGESNFRNIVDVTGSTNLETVRPYLKIQNQINQTGEIFFELSSIASEEQIIAYNECLDDWERAQGYEINIDNGLVSIESYEQTTLSILSKLLELSKLNNPGQKEFNQTYLRNCGIVFEDDLKRAALQNVFVNSHILLIYGAAGTGKTLLLNYISNLMSKQKKLFLTKTHTAKQNLQRRIDNPGADAEFVSIDSFTKKVTLTDYDVIFVDECSTIDNRTMCEFLKKTNPNTFLVLAGDIHQIESIDFGNWFFYAKDIINTYGANVELLNTWRTKDPDIVSLWDDVRNRGELIVEKLAMDGPFSEEIGEKIFEEKDKDEVILCLNYDGKFGLNNMNSYFQNDNSSGEPVAWQEWTYKIGDHILFNDSQRFSILYNNLKGTIVNIEKRSKDISFTIDVATNLTKDLCEKNGIEFISAKAESTRIRFTVYAYDDSVEYAKDEDRMNSVIPFQLAYAVSIHKAQGLEYDSVKVIIPKSNSEKITHGIFYTAITRAKKKLKIYWSSEIMEEIVESFKEEEATQRSLEIIRKKLHIQ